MKTSLARLLAIGAVAAAAAAPTAALAQSAQPSGRLVLYTSQPDADAQQTVDAFRAAYPNVEVTWTRSGTVDLMNRLRAEFQAGNPQPDVLLIADAVAMEGLKAENRLRAFPGAPVAPYQAGLYDADRTYFGTKLITTGIAVNANAPFRPTSWADLLRPEARGQVIMPSPLYSGAAAIHMAATKDVQGLGMAFYEGLQRQGATATRGNGGVMQAVAGGQKMFGVIVDFLPIREKAKGVPVDFVFPSEGVSAVTEPVAILSTARNVPAAEAFVSFLLSREGQELATRQGYMPMHPDVAPPAGFPRLSEIRIMPLDAQRALADDEANKRAFADMFGG